MLCLDLWQGFDDSGPYMHSIHFSFKLGAFLAPILSIFAETSVVAFGILTAFMGIVMAPIYASSMLWIDQFMTV